MKKIFITLFAFISFTSCGSFDDINLDPDSPTLVTSDYLATKLLLQTTTSLAGQPNTLFNDTWIMKTTIFTEMVEPYLYNKFERDDFSGFYNMTDAQKMVELAENNSTMSEGEKNSYKALAEFIRAWYFYGSTMAVGDIPCSDALKGESEGNFTPKYDTQEEVFTTIIKELRNASALFAKASTFKGDPIMNGDPSLWQRVVNTFTLRVLNMLSKKTTVGEYNVKTLFEQIANEPLLRSSADDFQRVYDASKTSQWYPFYYEQNGYWSYAVITSFFIDIMKDLGDYRLFYYADPFRSGNTAKESSFDAYKGMDPLIIQTGQSDDKYSAVNSRYYKIPQGEPIKFVAYSELQFILAEAALHGWKTPLTAKEHYDNGVKAAIKFTADNTPDEYRHGVVIDDAYIDSYLRGKAAFNPEKGVEQIMIQKLIGSFVQLKYNSYFDYRRTGYPKLPINPETNMNEVKTQLPIRWMYPEQEYTNNSANVNDAIKRQFDGRDTPNEVMWLLK